MDSIRSAASIVTAVRRSTALIPRSRDESNVIWQGRADGADVFRSIILGLLLGDGCAAGGVSPQSMLDEQIMKFDQGGNRNTWRPHLHPNTGHWIQHPSCDGYDDSRRGLDMRMGTGLPSFDVLLPQAKPTTTLRVAFTATIRGIFGTFSDTNEPPRSYCPCASGKTACHGAGRLTVLHSRSSRRGSSLVGAPGALNSYALFLGVVVYGTLTPKRIWEISVEAA